MIPKWLEAIDMIYIGSDHAGFELKETLKQYIAKLGYEIKDMGAYRYEQADDFPEYALKVCREVLKSKGQGILICGTGQGMERTANKIRGIYAAVCWNEMTARVAKEHGDTNVISLGGRTTSPEEAERIVRTWLESKFTGESRHVRRNNQIKEIEKKYMKEYNT